MKAIVLTDQAAGTGGMTLVGTPQKAGHLVGVAEPLLSIDVRPEQA